MKKAKQRSGAELLIDCLRTQGVKYIFGIPGAAIMPILEVLRSEHAVSSTPQFILCRHEQNAAFMAQCWGRLTGTPGVCLVTAGPGATNALSGIATATADRDPVLVITGETSTAEHFKKTHQTILTAELYGPVTKWSADVIHTHSIPEAVSTAFHIALSPHQGAVHLALPINVQTALTSAVPIAHHGTEPQSMASAEEVLQATDLLRKARFPVVLLGLGARTPDNAIAVRHFLERHQMIVVGTFEAAGVVSRDLAHLFCGRVGLKAREPGDIALEKADLVVTIGYDIVEYTPALWGCTPGKNVIHIDDIPADTDQEYQPVVELVGHIAENLGRLSVSRHSLSVPTAVKKAQALLRSEQERGKHRSTSPVHPLRFIYEARRVLPDNTIVISDVGAHQMWLAKYFFSYEPLTLLFSMGFQTMGVGLPWAIAASLARPGVPILSISGDGSFLMSATELETAVRLKAPIVHVVWRDGSYNLVKIQQLEAYGKGFAVEFGNPDIVAFAKSFGARAYRITKPSQIAPTLKKALRERKPTIIDMPVDYRDNLSLLRPKELLRIT
ncbi:MAG: acetolactate synthase AlsS [Patescibacteria group bacterium]